jgi:hypothetical protein
MNQLPRAINDEAEATYGISLAGMSPGLALMFNDRLYERCKQIAGVMSKAEGITPPHLLGNGEACFAVVTRAITWRLDPFAVMAATYQTPGGRVGFEGKLIQAILENSGMLEGPVTYELIGEWNRIRGKHRIAKSAKGHDYAVPDWKPEDEEGLGVVVRAKVKGEREPREMEPFMLRSCFPRNSTLWALRPDQQIKYTACRAFGNTVAPGILMGVPFDSDADGGGSMIDVTPPRPTRSAFADGVVDDNGTAKPMGHTSERLAEAEAMQRQSAEAKAEAERRGIYVEEPEPTEFGPADAFNAGREAREQKRPLLSPPKEWPTGDEAEQKIFIEAWQAGWRAADADLAAAARAAGPK